MGAYGRDRKTPVKTVEAIRAYATGTVERNQERDLFVRRAEERGFSRELALKVVQWEYNYRKYHMRPFDALVLVDPEFIEILKKSGKKTYLEILSYLKENPGTNILLGELNLETKKQELGGRPGPHTIEYKYFLNRKIIDYMS